MMIGFVMVMMVMMVMVVIVMMIVIVRVIVRVFDLEELRLDFENAVEIEGVAAEHVGDRHRAFHRFVEFGVGVDRADARLDLGEFRRRHEIGLVEHDDVGEGDLAFCFRRILQAFDKPFGVGDRDDRVEAGRVWKRRRRRRRSAPRARGRRAPSSRR